jgi:hypothetical protein
MSKSETDDQKAIFVQLDPEEYDRLNEEKQAMGLTWRAYLLQADHSHLRTRAEGGSR